MGKIVKYCSSCDEGFAERFGFCPDCGAPLQAFEMNPISGEINPEVNTAETNVDAFQAAPEAVVDEFENVPVREASVPVTEAFSFHEDPEEEPVEEVVPGAHFEQVEQVEEVEPAAQFEGPEEVVEATAAGSYFAPPATEAFSVPPTEAFSAPAKEETFSSYIPDSGYHVTVIEEKDTGTRNGLLIAASVLMITFLLSGTVYSLFNKNINIGSIGDNDLFALIPEVDPAMVEIEKPEVKKKDDAGGGGGGGNKDPEPAAKGAPPAMMKQPEIAPDVNMVRLENPTLTQKVGVKGPDQSKIDVDKRYGLLNGLDNDSNGPGSGGGIGTGRNGGVGSGDGSGLGSGSGGGAGAGNGGGIGDGNGTGRVGAPPPRPVGVTVGLNIISKPRPNYTDAARQNNVQGTVRLRVTFLASGQIGSIAAISGLPYGLTEQAIAAARNIKFEPKKVNGQPLAVTKQVEYTFSIY